MIWKLMERLKSLAVALIVYSVYRYYLRVTYRLSARESRRLKGKRKGGAIASLPHGKTHYSVKQDKTTIGPLVVLVHGFEGSSEYFDPFVSFLTRVKKRRVLTFDLFGRGYSECRGTRQTPDLFAGQLAELLLYLKETGPVDLVGYSMGGIVATRFAACYPHCVRSLILIAPAGLPSMRKKLPSYLDVVLSIPGMSDLLGWHLVRSFSRKHLAKQWCNPGESRFEEQYRIEKRRRKVEPALARAVGSALAHMPWGEIEQDLRLLNEHKNVIVVALWGSKDKTVPPRGAAEIAAILPRVIVNIVDDLGHAAPIEAAELIAYEVFAALESAIEDTAVAAEEEDDDDTDAATSTKVAADGSTPS